LQPLSNTFCSFPAIPGVGFVADKVKVAAVSALTEGLRPLEIRVGQVPEVDHVGMAEYASSFCHLHFIAV
jgi:hypothetical protein